MKFLTKSLVLEMPKQRLEQISKKYKVLNEKCEKFQIMLSKKSYALDYIMNLPKELRNNKLSVEH